MALTREERASLGSADVTSGGMPALLRAGDAANLPRPGRSRSHLDLSERKALLFVGDAIALTTALSLGLLVLPPDVPHAAPQLSWHVALVGIWLGIAAAAECYDLRTAARWRASVASACRAGLATVALSLATPFVWPPLLAAGHAALSFALGSILLLTGWRIAYAYLVSRPRLRTRVLVVGAGWEGQAIIGAIRELGGGYEAVGFVDRGPGSWESIADGVPVIGDVDDLTRLVGECRVDTIVLAETADLHGEHHAALLDCFERGVRLTRLADLYESITCRVLAPRAGQDWLDILPPGVRSGLFHAVFHRGLDLAFAIPGAIALVLVLPFVSLAIRLDSPGPIFYSQERVGKHGRRFWITKLRSMRQDAEASGQAVWATESDSRVTRVGKILRKTRIDELPQVLSILRGDMSLIGPRPERPVFVDLLDRRLPCYRARHLVRPGLTGWAQVMYRYGSSVEDARVKLQYDLYYIKHESALLDLLTILKTVGIVLRCKGT